jgi:hypothetical protein
VQLQAGHVELLPDLDHLGINVDADAAGSGPLALQDVAAAQVRFDVRVVGGMLLMIVW